MRGGVLIRFQMFLIMVQGRTLMDCIPSICKLRNEIKQDSFSVFIG